MPDPSTTGWKVSPPGRAQEKAERPTPWYFRWYGVLALMPVLFVYVLLGGPRLNGRVITAILGENMWVQGAAAWLWVFTIGALYDRASAGAFGAGRGTKIAQWTAGLMVFFAWTIAPIGRGPGAGTALGQLSGANEAPGFALGLVVALPTIGLGYWLVNRRKWKEEDLDREAGWRADAHAFRFGIPHEGSGRWVLHPAWLKPDDRPAYAKRILDEYLVPADDLTPHELAYLEDKLREAGRAPRDLLLPPRERKRRRKRRR